MLGFFVVGLWFYVCSTLYTPMFLHGGFFMGSLGYVKITLITCKKRF